MSVCVYCGRQYLYVSGSGNTKKKCSSCLVNHRRFANKIKALEYKGGECALCGYNKCNKALHFHHYKGVKKFTVSANHCRSWEVIKEELDKCILLCANCHSEVHSGLVILPLVVQ